MKRLWLKICFSVAAVLSLAVSCGPLTYTVSVDKRVGMDVAIDFGDNLPGILVVSQDAADSSLLYGIANGMAVRLESELGLVHGAVPVYSLPSDSIAGVDRSYLHDVTGVDYLVMVDSLTVGEYKVERPREKAYYNGQYHVQTIVKLPIIFGVDVFSVASETPLFQSAVEEEFNWSLFSLADMSDITATGRVEKELVKTFERIGSTIVDEFMPGWETVNRLIYYFNSEKWMRACEYAYMFEWQKAMEIWLTEADSPNTHKAYCAAHNISVACEVLEMNDLAQEWKERAQKLELLRN